ncbi:MAG: LacI family DNA-binding transcriptional regulator [Lunatimonas sp.]|uniref:LacI family DNA-binding transcriptional regulator n=1 Tax=Lunatimonas sp. TaxID=2060141 RepID=UPI00263ADB31|nr:LacI family DNA-binding transcriptional regulator [Lunatimonas sp.]MCC5937524.1 LacI family DNA-binding transcriptional regulator [Lunatimonas sp.]
MARRKKVSLKDIAEKAGVSTALVSYVLNGKEKESRVGAETALKIKELAKQFNYTPNFVAKSLRSGKTFTIGLIIADIANPFFASIAREIENEAKDSGYTVIIGSSDERSDKFRDLLSVFIDRQLDGLIIVSTEGSADQIKSLQRRKIPFVLLDRYFPEIDTDFVSIDSYQASFSAAQHLLQNGFKRIGFIGYESKLFHMKERKRGVWDAMRQAGIKVSPGWTRDLKFDEVETSMYETIKSMLDDSQSIDSIIFGTYRLAINGLKAIRLLKVKIPSELAIVSYGQAESFELYECPITYLEQPLTALGKKAVEILLDRIENNKEEKIKLLMKAQLKIGESSNYSGKVKDHSILN